MLKTLRPRSLESPGPELPVAPPLLGGSWVVVSGVISRVTTVMSHIRGFITLLITTHELPIESMQLLVRRSTGILLVERRRLNVFRV